MQLKMRIRTKRGHKVISINRRKAIHGRCLNCSAWFTPDVTDCTMTDCHLYPYRLGTEKQNAKERIKAIQDYCSWCCAESPQEKMKCPSFDCPLWPYRKSGVDKTHQYQGSDAEIVTEDSVWERQAQNA